MKFRKIGDTKYDPTDRPGGPLVSYYAKKGGKLPQANFTDYSGSQMYGKGGTIHINPANKGKFNATKARTGKTTEELTHSSNPVTKKRAIFAQNAAKWKHHADGGPLDTDYFRTDKKAFVDSTLNANKNLDFVQRLYDYNAPDMQVKGMKGRSTHLMSDDPGSMRAYPEVVRKKGQSNLTYLGQGDAAWDYADSTKEYIPFNSAEKARWFANSPNNTTGYKMGTGVRYTLPKKLQGGPLLVSNQHVAMGGSLKQMYDQGGALNVAYANGGPRKPAPTTDPRKVQSYKDSLNLYNKYHGEITNTYDNEVGLRYLLPADREVVMSNKIKPIGYRSVSKGIDYPVYAKPLQPYYLQEQPAPQVAVQPVQPTVPFKRDTTMSIVNPGQEWYLKETQGYKQKANGGMVFQNPVGMATKIAQDYKNNQYGNGGTIHIKPENKGKFTAWAQSHNMGVQEAASHVMANKEDYSSTIVKRANFAKNAAGWKHANGGKLNPYTLNIVSNGFKKFGTGGGWVQLPDGSWEFKNPEAVDLGKNQSLFSAWSQNKNIDQLPAQNQEGIFTLDETQNQREPVTDPLLASKGTDPGFKNQKLAANLYSGGIQAGTSLVASFAEKNQRRQMGAHDDGSADEVIGTAKGMAKGAAIGSNFGPIGTAAGAFIGGVTGYFGGKASGREKKRAFDQWESDYMKSEQEQAKARAASLQDFKPTASGYYGGGGRLPKSYKWKPNTSLLNTPVYDKTPKQMENFSPAIDYAGNVATQTVLDQNPYGKALNIYHTGQDVVKAGKNNEYLKAAGLIGSEFVKLGVPVLGDAAVNSFQEALSPSDNMVKSFMPPKKKAMGGSLASNYMSKQKAVGGSLVPLSSDAVEVKGPSHANGGVKLPEIGAEVEGKEVIKDDYVFSEQLGFAKEAKKLAKAKGIVENKPATRERINTLKLLQDKENQLKLAQEFIRKQNNLA